MDFLFIVLGWLLVVGGARRFQVEVSHYGIHYRIFKVKILNRVLVELVSTVFCVQDWNGYWEDHIQGHHKGDVFCGPNDADWKFLQRLGLRAGMSRRACWYWLFTTALSPAFHIIFFATRLKANFVSPSVWRKLMAIVWWAGLLAAVNSLDVWFYFAIFWLVPLTVLYQISALVQFTSEHFWGAPFIEGESARTRQARLSHARYCLSPLPDRADYASTASFILGLVLWVGVTLVVDVPARIACIVGDLPVHDRHHRFAGDERWAEAMYRPEEDGALKSAESWGLISALNSVFDHISSLPEDAPSGKR